VGKLVLRSFRNYKLYIDHIISLQPIITVTFVSPKKERKKERENNLGRYKHKKLSKEKDGQTDRAEDRVNW